MAGYSSTPLWKKLGYKNALTAWIDGAPAEYRSLLALPKEIRPVWLDSARPGLGFAHVFATQSADLKRKLDTLRRVVAQDGVLWISWPKKTSGVATDITENIVRDLALPLGFVDIKVCAVDEVWSGLKLMIRKTQRTSLAEKSAVAKSGRRSS